jgi:signal peptidase
MRILAGAVTALRRFVDVVLVALIIVVLFGLILGKLVPVMGRQTVIIGGGSMEPAIGLGSAIVIEPVAAADLVVGDVVSMQVGPQQTVFTHRIISVIDRADGRWIRTQGDANAAPDPTIVPATAVMGRLELVVPYAGYLLALLSLPVGVMFILGLAAALLAMAWLLESLELDAAPKRTERRSGSLADEPIETDTHPLERPLIPSGVEVFLRGEPIAVRPTGSAFIAHAPGVGALVGSLVATGRGWPELADRSPVRSHLERSRQVRERRADWLRGGRGPLD